PESQLDRFLMRLVIGYPPANAERTLLKDPALHSNMTHLKAIINPEQLILLQKESQLVIVSELILDYVQQLLVTSRDQGWFQHGLSPRAGLGLIRAAQAYAKTDDRDFIRPDDIQAVLPSIVNHRLIIKKSHAELSAAELLLNEVEVPM
ncbi:MAG: MoxR family ATPase, partial [bacterium]|nr:MoxR family ATPase [bacterium]